MTKNAFISFVAVMAVLLAAMAGFTACSRQENSDSEVIQVGVILNLTGGLSQADTPKLRALEVALAYLKKQAPADAPIHSVQLVTEDGRTDPKAGIAAFQKLYSSGIRIFITGSSMNAMSLFPLTEEAKCLLFGVSGHPDFAKNGEYSFRMYPRINTGVSHMLQLLKEQGDPSVYVFYTDEPFGQSYASTLKKKYPNVVGEESFQITQSDFKNGVAKLEASGANRVVVIGYGIGEKNLLRQMIERRLFIPVVGSEVFYYASLDLPGFAEVDGVEDLFGKTRFLGPTLLEAILKGQGDEFVRYYSEKTGEKAPQLFGVFAADSLILLAEALQKTQGNADPVVLQEILSNSGKMKLFSGQAEMLPTRELEYDLGDFALDSAGHAQALGTSK